MEKFVWKKAPFIVNRYTAGLVVAGGGIGLLIAIATNNLIMSSNLVRIITIMWYRRSIQ